MDPLKLLPTEVVLRILDFTPVSDVANLTQACRDWHVFIDEKHQNAIYGHPAKTWRPYEHRDMSFISNLESFAKHFDDTESWRDLCKRQTMLRRNWNRKNPVTRESIVQVGNDAIWRFRVDFKRRIILSTSQEGGFYVTDMDSGSILWTLSASEVPPCAHLEYDDGTAVWNSENDTLQVWRTGLLGQSRGEFAHQHTLSVEYRSRGFELTDGTLVVVGEGGNVTLYSLTDEQPVLLHSMKIETGATGHVDQNRDTIMICFGTSGYVLYDKQTGLKIGSIDFGKVNRLHHINHLHEASDGPSWSGHVLDYLPSVQVFPPANPSTSRLASLDIEDGALPRGQNEDWTRLEDDEWGAAVLSERLLVATSKGGRVFVCTNWRSCMENPKRFADFSLIIECESDGSFFDLGGWLSVKEHRIMFEVFDRVYVVSLDLDDQDHSCVGFCPSFSFLTSSTPQLTTPVSFMTLGDDCIMSTFTVSQALNVINKPTNQNNNVDSWMAS